MDAVLRIIGAGGAMLTVGAIGLQLLFARREIPVRLGRDVLRIAIALGTVVLMAVILAVSTPWGLVIAAPLVGLALGYVQGTTLKVREVSGRLMAHRSIPALLAWGAGILIMQVAGVANRSGAVAVGQGVAFFSLGLMVGLVIGRAGPVSRARTRAPAGSRVALLAVAALGVGLLLPASVDAQSQGMTSEEAVAYLESLVDWSRAELIGGFQFEGKPRIPAEISPALNEIPAPHSQTVTFTDPQGSVWDLSETFTFEPRDTGSCCSLDYVVDATETAPDGTQHVYHAEALDLAFGPTLRLAPGHPPFGQELMYVTPDGSAACARAVAETSFRNEYTTLTVDGRPSEGVILNPEILVPCDAVQGFTVEAAVAALPPVPAAEAAERRQSGAAGCPVYQEMFTALWDPQMVTAERLSLGALFAAPNDAACVGGIQFGRELPGEPKVRATWAFSGLEVDADQLADFEDRVANYTEATQADNYNECPVDAAGLPVYDPEEPCDLIVIAEQPVGSDILSTFAQPQTRQVIIHYDGDTSDGPNVTIEVHDATGTYGFYFHHYEPDDPLIRQTVGGLQGQLSRGVGGFGPATATPPPTPEPDEGDQPVADDQATGDSTAAGDQGADDGAGEQATAAPGDEEPAEDGDDEGGVDPAGAAAAGLVGLLGAALLVGQTLVDAGVPASQVMEAWRKNGIDGLRDLAAHREEAGGYEPPPPPPPPTPDQIAGDVAGIEVLEDDRIPDDVETAIEKQLVAEQDREAVDAAVARAIAAAGDFPDHRRIGEMFDLPEVQKTFEGLTPDQFERAKAAIIEQMTAERTARAAAAVGDALDLPVFEEGGPLAGQPKGDIGTLVAQDAKARDAIDRLPTEEEQQIAEKGLIHELSEGRREQAAREALEVMTRVAAAEDIRQALDAGDARLVKEILDGLDPEVAREIWEEAQQGRPPIDLDTMEAVQPADLTTRSPLTGTPRGDVWEAVTRNEEAMDVIKALPEVDGDGVPAQDAVKAEVIEELSGRRTRQATEAIVAAARRESLVVSVRAAAEAGDPDAIDALLEGLDEADRQDVLQAATSHMEGFDPEALPPPPPGGPPPPDPDIGIDVGVAVTRESQSAVLEGLSDQEAEAALAAARAELESARDAALDEIAREAVEPPAEDTPWQDPYQASRGEGVEAALQGQKLSGEEIAEVQDRLQEHLRAEQQGELTIAARTEQLRNEAVAAIRRAQAAGNAAEIARILDGLSDADREAVLQQLE